MKQNFNVQSSLFLPVPMNKEGSLLKKIEKNDTV